MMKLSVRIRLSAIMFLEYFIWGAWYVTMGTYLFVNFKANAVEVGAAYAVLSIAAMVSPFIVGLVADRFFMPRRILGVLHLCGCILLYYLGLAADFNTFWWLMLLYTLVYMPTLSLVNSISFAQMQDTGKEFPKIRVFGTLGWITAGLVVGGLGIESSVHTFWLAGLCSLLLAILTCFLPVQSVSKVVKSVADIVGSEAFVLFKRKSFVVFFLASIAVCIPLSFYYSFANPFLQDIELANATGKMTLGQLSEFLCMLLIPILFRSYGVKKMLIIGIAAWGIRYLLFAFGNIEEYVWMIYVGIILHGICYDFFFVTGQIYTDTIASAEIKNAAQGMITFATYGIGMFIGSMISGYFTSIYTIESNGILIHDWRSIWLIPATIAAVTLFLFFVFFNGQPKTMINTEV